jgi:t-SNARE complex subunit (syntaxin)
MKKHKTNTSNNAYIYRLFSFDFLTYIYFFLLFVCKILHRDVLKLEQSVMELHQMFVDFALLTNQQGELLDQIEFNVHAAEEFIQGGNEDLTVAIEIQSSIMKKQCCIIITVLIIGVIIMFATGFLP